MNHKEYNLLKQDIGDGQLKGVLKQLVTLTSIDNELRNDALLLKGQLAYVNRNRLFFTSDDSYRFNNIITASTLDLIERVYDSKKPYTPLEKNQDYNDIYNKT